MIILNYAKDSIRMCVIMIVGMDGEWDEDGDGTGVSNGQIDSSNSGWLLARAWWFWKIWKKHVGYLSRLGSQSIVPHWTLRPSDPDWRRCGALAEMWGTLDGDVVEFE